MQHFWEFLFQRDDCGLFIIRSGCEAHRKGDPVRIHEQSHFHQRRRLVLFGNPIFTEAFYQFTRNFVKIIFIRRFRFKVEVGAVIIAYWGVPPDDTAAGFIQMGNVFIVTACHNIQRTVDVLVAERRLLIITVKVFEAVKLWAGIQDTVIGQETVHKVRVKSNSGSWCDFLKKRADAKPVVKLLEKQVAYV